MGSESFTEVLTGRILSALHRDMPISTLTRMVTLLVLVSAQAGILLRSPRLLEVAFMLLRRMYVVRGISAPKVLVTPSLW